MSQAIKFLIIIPTYNRNELLNDAVKSVFDQTYADWQLVVSDNVSTRPVWETLPPSYLADPRLQVIRQEKHTIGKYHGEALLAKALGYDFDYFVVLHDDDILIPYALEYIVKQGRGHNFVCGSHYLYFQNKQEIVFENWGREPIVISSLNCIKHNAFTHGVRLKPGGSAVARSPLIGPTHVGNFFIKKHILVKAIDKFGQVMNCPFGDIGYGKLSYLAGEQIYLPIPLGVVRIAANYGTTPAVRGNRFFLLKHHDLSFKVSPLKGVSYANAILESHLVVIDALRIPYEPLPRPVFFLRHIREILGDAKYNHATHKDLLEALSFYRSPRLLLGSLWHLLAAVGRKLLRLNQPKCQELVWPKINSIFEAADLAVNNYREHI